VDAGNEILAHVLALPEFTEANTVLLFVPLPDEVDVIPIINHALDARKTVAVPKVDLRGRRMRAVVLRDPGRDLRVGPYGIPEPQFTKTVQPEAIDFVLVPARGFDRHGNRLGRGAGYYDRYMAQSGFRATRCGVALAAQVLDQVPHTLRDLPVHLLVTEEGVLRFARAGPS
jgi:5-formyltetrahydrofolate cyclo-ligase